MGEVSTPDADDNDDLDLSGEDSRNDIDDTSADTGDVEDQGSEDDNAPSDAEADSSDDDKSTTENDDAEKAPVFDKDLDAWAEKRGYGKLDTDKERRIAQDARNSQADFTRRREAAAKLSKAAADSTADKSKDDDDADPLAKEVGELRTELRTERQNRQLSEFLISSSDAGTPVSTEEVEAMGEYLKKTHDTDGETGVNFLLKDINRWHKLASLDMDKGTEGDSSEISDKVRAEERARLAKKTAAAGPSRSAKTTQPAKAANEVEAIWKDDNI